MMVSKSGFGKIRFQILELFIHLRHVISLQSTFIYQAMDDCGGIAIFLSVISGYFNTLLLMQDSGFLVLFSDDSRVSAETVTVFC